MLRKAREIVEKSVANSEERFNRVVLGETTFWDQAKKYLRCVQTRDRKPIKDTSSIEAALNKWILPKIGDLPLGNVHNITVKPLVDKMKKSLSARTGTSMWNTSLRLWLRSRMAELESRSIHESGIVP